MVPQNLQVYLLTPIDRTTLFKAKSTITKQNGGGRETGNGSGPKPAVYLYSALCIASRGKYRPTKYNYQATSVGR